MPIIHELHRMLTASDANELNGDSVSPPFLSQYAVPIRQTVKTRRASGARGSNTLCGFLTRWEKEEKPC